MVKHLKGDSLRLAPTFLSNIRLGLEELAKDKHSSLLRKFVNYGRKKFYNIGPWYCHLDTTLTLCHTQDQIQESNPIKLFWRKFTNSYL